MSTPMIKLTSSDGVEMNVGMLHHTFPLRSSEAFATKLTDDIDRHVAERSILIKNMMEDIGEQTEGEAVPIPNVSDLLSNVFRARTDQDATGQ